MPCRCTDIFPKKKSLMQVLVGLTPSSQTAGALFRTPLARKVIWKIDLSIAPITNLSISAITNFYLFVKVFYFFVDMCDLRIASIANFHMFAKVFLLTYDLSIASIANFSVFAKVVLLTYNLSIASIANFSVFPKEVLLT